MRKNVFILHIIIVIIWAVCLNSTQLIAQTNDPEEYLSIKLKEKKVILGVKEPANWVGDLVRAGEFYADALFYKDKKTYQKGAALIKVIVYEKRDENTIADLAYDTQQFKKEYKKVKIEELNFVHSEYVTFSRLLYVKKNKYEYICYLNPGREFSSGILVTMRTLGQKASPLELQIYDEILRSVHLSLIEDLSTNPANPPSSKQN